MTENRKVWLVRHALREDNNPKDWSKTLGHMTDPDLHPIGMSMSRRLATRLSTQPVDHILVSPFLRTLRTGHFVSQAMGIPMKVECGFHEQLAPAWFPNGAPPLPTLEERLIEFPSIDLLYRSDARRPALMESPEDPNNPLLARVDAAIAHVLNALSGNLVIISHYAITNVLTHSLTGSFSSCYIDLTSVTELTYRAGRWENPNGPDCAHVHDILAKGDAWTDPADVIGAV
jgi:broad specificity phosphatase PhoE